MQNATIVLICSIAISGCSAFSVYDSDGTNKKGVPFFLKTGKVKQTTSYTRSWIEATINFSVINGDNAEHDSQRVATIRISKETYDQYELIKAFADADKSAMEGGFSGAVTSLQTSLSKSCKGEPRINCVINQQTMSDESSPTNTLPKLLFQALESNSSEYVTLVDYDKPYYFNATIPAFGTATATAKLAPDGTLTEATSTVDSTKLAELIPLKELLLSKLGLEKTGQTALSTGKIAPYSLTLSITDNGYKYGLVKFHPYSSGLNFEPLKFSDKDVSVTRVKYADQSAKKDDPKKNSISIEGTIVLPEGK